MNYQRARKLTDRLADLVESVRRNTEALAAAFDAGDMCPDSRELLASEMRGLETELESACFSLVGYFAGVDTGLTAPLGAEQLERLTVALQDLTGEELGVSEQLLRASTAAGQIARHLPSTTTGSPHDLTHRGTVMSNMQDLDEGLRVSIAFLRQLFPHDPAVLALRAFIARRLNGAT